jgi:antitoxin component of MazEF toxin-antitoxin module
MRVKIAKWGNSAAIRLPKAVMEEMRLDEGGELDLSMIGGELRAVAVRSGPSPTLDQLVAEMKQLGGADYDFGAEEWDILPTEIGDYDGFHEGE